MRRTLFVALWVGSGGLVLFLALIYVVIGNPLDPFDDRTFSVTAWRNANQDIRAKMARSAVRDHLPAGLTETQVVALLGKPDNVIAVEDDGGHKLPGVQTYSYFIGSSDYYGFDDAFLYVHFNAARRVLSAEVNGY